MWLLTLALQVNIKFTEDKHLTSSLIRLECPVTETQGQPVLGEMKETERREPLEARTQLEAFTGVPGAWPTSRSGSDKPLDYPLPGESPHVLCESPLRTEDSSPPTSWSPLKAENVGTRKGPNPSLFPYYMSQDSNVEKTSHLPYRVHFPKVSLVDRQIK